MQQYGLKTCKVKQLKPNYINIKINRQKPQDKKTTTNAIRFRINQENKFLYRNKQHLNQQLYYLHLASAHQHNGMWQDIEEYIDEQISRLMDNLYHKLNRNVYALTNQTSNKHNNNENACKFQSRLINLTNMKFTRDQIQTLSLGPNYAIEQETKQYINKLIIDTENAARPLEPKIQNTYHYLAAKQIKHILSTNRQNMLQNRYRYNLSELKKTLLNKNLTTLKVDKSKSIVIIDKTTLWRKVDNLVQENNIKQLSKDPTDTYQKQIQQTVKIGNVLVSKWSHKYLINIKPTAPKLDI